MEIKQSACSFERTSQRARPAYDVVLPSTAKPADEEISAIGAAAALVILALNVVCARNGVGLSLAISGAAATAYFIFQLRLWFESRDACERITMCGAAICISYFARGRLVEQRRLKLRDFAIEIHGDLGSRCALIALRHDDDRRKPVRKIEIARSLTPSQRIQFLEGFLEELRLAGIEPRIFQVVTGRESAIRRYCGEG